LYIPDRGQHEIPKAIGNRAEITNLSQRRPRMTLGYELRESRNGSGEA
jgi:hypothetical protein